MECTNKDYFKCPQKTEPCSQCTPGRDCFSTFVAVTNSAIKKLTQAHVTPLTPSGLKWTNAGTAQPTQGRKIDNSSLAKTLTSKTDFSQEEWDLFGIQDLHFHDFIKSDSGVYFKPAVAQPRKFLYVHIRIF
jgi:hypothetical protein